jgi:HK97 family phage prohead protease
VKIETRAVGIAPTLAEEGKFVEGRAAVFYNPADTGTEYVFELARDKGPPIRVRERIMKGAFDQAVREDDVRCLYNHRDLLGRRKASRSENTLGLSADDHGLNYRCGLPGHSYGQIVREALQRGDLDGSSFGFWIREGGVTYRQEGDELIRELTALGLNDVSPVDFPAYRAANSGLRFEVRAAFRPDWEVRQIETVLGQKIDLKAIEAGTRQRDQDRLRLLSLRMQLHGGGEKRAADVSYLDLFDKLRKLICAATGLNWVYMEDVRPGYCVYEVGDSDVMFKQDYTQAENGDVALVGVPQRVREVTTFEAV